MAGATIYDISVLRDNGEENTSAVPPIDQWSFMLFTNIELKLVFLRISLNMVLIGKECGLVLIKV